MKSPWLDIALSDYEGHMALPEIGQAAMLGIPGLPIVDIPFPFASLPPDEARARGAQSFDAIVAALTKNPA